MDEHETIEWNIAGDREIRGIVREIILDSRPISRECAGGLKTKNKSVREHGGMSSTGHGMKAGAQDTRLLEVVFERLVSFRSGVDEVRCINEKDSSGLPTVMASLLLGDGEAVGVLPGDE